MKYIFAKHSELNGKYFLSEEGSPCFTKKRVYLDHLLRARKFGKQFNAYYVRCESMEINDSDIRIKFNWINHVAFRLLNDIAGDAYWSMYLRPTSDDCVEAVIWYDYEQWWDANK